VIATGYQFLHIEAYGREGAHKKNLNARKPSMYDIADEMGSAPHACSHVVKPLPPRLLFGMDPWEALVLAASGPAKPLIRKAHYRRRSLLARTC
jgi:hypothetical protein